MKTRTLSSAKKATWKVFSEYIRRRDGGVCFTCGKKDHYKNQNAGHFIHKDCLDYNEININCQCVHCNKYLSGNLGIYAIKLIDKYGKKKIKDLEKEGHQVRKFTIQELDDLKAFYKERIAFAFRD